MSFIKKIQQKLKPKKERSNKENAITMPYSISLTRDGQVLYIISIEKIQDFKHSNNEKTTLYQATADHLASLTETIIVDLLNEKYILFELLEGTEINNVIMQKIGSYYMYEKKQTGLHDNISYLGRLTPDPNDYQILKSNGVKTYINNYVMPKIEQRRQNIIMQRRNEQILSEKAEADRNRRFREEARKQQIKYEQEREEQRRQRINNPYLTEVYKYVIDGKEYTNYDGINLSTGQILRLREVNKVGKDQFGTYLYSCYISNTDNTHDVEILSGPSGRPVMFISDKKIEKIIASNNVQELRSFLKFLSKVTTTGNASRLDYIGGFINGKDDEYSDSKLTQDIMDAATKLQEKYQREKTLNNRLQE